MILNILFIGSFLSQYRGTKSVSEVVADTLKSSCEHSFHLASKKENKLLRLYDIIRATLFSRYDFAHIDVFSDQAFYIAQVSSYWLIRRKKKIIMTLHGGKLAEFFEANREIFKNVVDRANIIQTPSLFLKFFFEKEGFVVNYLPNSLDLAKFTYKRNNIKVNTLLWVRAFDKIYNPWLAIQTLVEVVKKFPEATLTMIGPDKGELEKSIELANKLNVLSRINFVGAVPNEELVKFYQTHQVYLNTTSYESFGVAVCEAAACGIPIISTNVGEIPYLWEHEKNIFLVDNFSVKQMAEFAIQLLSNPSKALQLSTEGRINVEKFSIDKILPQWIQLFNSLDKAN